MWMMRNRNLVLHGQQQLLKADALQHAIFNSANFSSIATDAQGVIQLFNVGAERMLGYQAVDVVNRITPAGISDADELVARAASLSEELGTVITPGFEALVFKASRGIEDIYELTYIRKDGTRLPAIVSVSPLRDGRDHVIGYLLMGTDNTARKQAEAVQAVLDQRLRDQQNALQETNVELEKARATADKANRAKSEFLSSMSHELRTPLNAVLGFAQLLSSEKPPPPLRQQRSLDQIMKAGWYLLRLINEILDLAMIESGRVTMSQESMCLVDVLKDCHSMVAPLAQKRGVTMYFPEADQTLFAHADRTRVKQVMINLLSNAIKYNRPGGSVTVRCAAVENSVRVSVDDTGEGLTEEQLGQLFQPFNRLGRNDSSEEGTGIGLVVTRQLMELMSGTIGVDSEPGVGTTFWIELPASTAPVIDVAAYTAQPTQGPSTSSAPRTLLYVEDNPANLSLVEQLVERRGDLRLLTAIDGSLGLQLARTCLPDMILMDINLPGISGYGCLKILQTEAATARIPVVALSANAVPRDVERGIEAGFFRYLTKPINVVEFMDTLDIALQYAQDNKLENKLENKVEHHD
ncbi:ATP-binding protein [Pseudoduganella sp. LjRoot289]|uniref:PAS domain-containing hybrid sensor histidine kinase/response regulator n=1 Tax=Pseudoduganella sp. LjRoot289 TaxID=3342314 RepID=UPI003ECF680E